jgi:hypothetical protein
MRYVVAFRSAVYQQFAIDRFARPRDSDGLRRSAPRVFQTKDLNDSLKYFYL